MNEQEKENPGKRVESLVERWRRERARFCSIYGCIIIVRISEIASCRVEEAWGLNASEGTARKEKNGSVCLNYSG
jgi:hypothetical protein